MATDQLQAQLNDVLAAVLGIPASTITDDLGMKDTEAWDSLKHMELITSIEQTFAIQLSFDDIVRMQTMGAIKQVLSEKGLI